MANQNKTDPEKTNKAPATSCLFELSDEIKYAQSDDNKNDFSIVGYSGGIIPDHWYWGNLAFDLKGIKFAKKKTPVLEEHFTSSRIGFATKQEITDKVFFEGRFLQNENAKRMANDLKEGFPMEASLYIPPSIIEFVKEGAQTEVNGQILKGPGAVFRKSTIKEVSMCLFGADESTQTNVYDANIKNEVTFNLFKENTMADNKETKLTLEQFKSDNPDLHDQVFAAGKADGEKSEREMFAELKKACGDDNDLLVDCYSEGKSVNEALQMRAEKAETRNKELAEKLSKKPAEKPRAEDDPAVQEFSDTAVEPGKEKKKFADNEEGWKAEFEQSEELKNEFGKVDYYVNFMKNKKAGRVRILH